MKRLVAIAIGLGLAFSAMAQGTVEFRSTVSPRGLIYETDGTTLLADAAYKVDLFYGAVGASPLTFTSLGLAQSFLTGTGSGYFNAGTVSIPGFAGGTSVQIQARAWRASDGATWAAASLVNGAHVSGANGTAIPTVTVALGGIGSPPSSPATFTGSGVAHSLGTVVIIPEPSTILLGLAGLAGLVALRRKN